MASRCAVRPGTRFPGGAGADTDLGDIPVTLVGIALYDRPHRQTGRAVNGIELHPLLDIRFEGDPVPGGAVTPLVSPNEEEGGVTQLLANSSFEDGVTGWTGTMHDLGRFQGQQGRLGSNFAWMGGTGKADSETLYYNVSIPTATSVTIAFWLRLGTDEVTTTNANDKLYVQIRDKDGHVLKSLATYSNLDAATGWRQKTFDVSAFAGQDVPVFFWMV